MEYFLDISYDDATGKVTVDLDLPEIEDMPQNKIVVNPSGKRSIRSKSQTNLREDYANCVCGLSMYVAGIIFNTCLKIQEVEGGDVVVVAIAAYLHDIHRWLADGQQYMDPKDSLEVIDDIIAELDVSYLQREKILLAIEHHEEYDFGSNKVSVQDIEAKIIQDADNLDAIGAIGIGRAFAYSAIHKMPDYICDVELYRNEYTEGVNDVSTIHHVFNKLLRILIALLINSPYVII
jgi:uncharacterized protein